MVDRNINPSLLEPQPTVLEIKGFTPGTLVEIQKIFVASLQQPSYVARAIVNSADLSIRTSRVKSLTLACPFGFAIKFEDTGNGFWKAEERSTCCLSSFYKGACRTCDKIPDLTIFTDVYVRPALDQASVELEADDDDETSGDSGMQRLEDGLIARLERQGIETFSAFLIACEIRALLFELVHFNEINTFGMD